MQKTIHFALFLFIVTGLLFTGCAKDPAVEDMNGSLEESLELNTETTTSGSTTDSTSTSEEESAYKDGSYTETGTYMSPAGEESITVTLKLEAGLVKSVSIGKEASNEASKQYQTLFADGISSLVVGKPIDSLGSLGAVNGSSLTPKGFEEAVKAILSDAENA